MTDGQAPAGWYDDGQGRQRWFDGTAWTDHVHPAVAPPAVPAPPPPPPPPAAPLPPPPPPLADVPPGPASAYDEPARTGSRAAQAPLAKPFYKRAWFVVVATLLLLVAVGGVAAALTSSDSSSGTAAPQATQPVVPSTPATVASTPAPSTTPSGSATSTSSASATSTALSDGDWTVANYQLKDDGLGSFGGTARITYTGNDSTGGEASFTFTIFKSGKQIATAIGTALAVLPGQTKTVQLISTDKYVAGPYSMVDFQKDF